MHRLLLAVAARVTTDALLFAPFATTFFYICQGLMERRPLVTDAAGTQGIKERVEERLFGT